MTIPKQIFLFWNGPMPAIVEACIRRIRALHGTWSIDVLTEAEEAVEGFEALTVQWKSDWARMCALQRGGVWLDASCICTEPVDSWVDMASDEVQGFSAPGMADSLENWAFAAPPWHPLLIRWKQIFREAIAMGFDTFKSSAPSYIRSHAIYNQMPYLTMHACYLMAAEETGRRARLTPSCDGPFRYLCERNFDTAAAMEALMHQPLADPPPLIKLRGAETNMVPWLECKAGSFMSTVLAMPVGKGSKQQVRQKVIVVVALAIAVLAVFALRRARASSSARSTLVLARR